MRPASQPRAWWRLQTAAAFPGAVAIVQVRGAVSEALRAVGMADVPPGAVRLSTLAGVDRGLVARIREDLALLTPHGGPEILRRLCKALEAAGIGRDQSQDDAACFPEAGSFFRAALLGTLSRAASPRAVDLLLDQPRRWAEWGFPEPTTETPAPDRAHTAALDRLVLPPLVVALGASNIGKSTLLNRLAGRGVAIVADEPGTTRDHVGALVLFDGLVVRYLDTPGIRPDATTPEREAMTSVEQVAPMADLLLLLGDGGRPPPRPAWDRPSLRVALRADLGEPAWDREATVSAATGAGLESLAMAIREALVPAAALASPLPWRFWSDPGS